MAERKAQPMIETLADLKPDPRNARRHNPRNVGMLEKALGEVGAARSIVIDEHGVVLAGNATIEAAGRAGIERVQVVDADGETIIAVRRTGLTAKQKTRLALYDNRTAELADWDSEVIADMLATEREVLDGLFENYELEEIVEEAIQPVQSDAEPRFDQAAELLQKWKVEAGDLWLVGEHRLLCGDSTKAADVARLMAEAKINLCFTSPPYNSKGGGYHTDYYGKIKKFYNHECDDRTEDEWVEFCDKVLQNICSHLKSEDSPVVWNVMYTAHCRSGYGRTMFAGSHELSVKETICWDKGSGFPTASKGILSRNWELVFVLSKGNKYTTTQGENEPRWAKWDISRPKQQEEHKATFPVELVSRALSDFGVNGDAVYDPFLGSGTTMVAAQNLQRKCYGIEISPAYCAVILERMQAAFPDIKIERAP